MNMKSNKLMGGLIYHSLLGGEKKQTLFISFHAFNIQDKYY